MTLELIQVIALLCANQYPGYQEACQKKYILCVKDKSYQRLGKNEKPDSGLMLALCVIEKVPS